MRKLLILLLPLFLLSTQLSARADGVSFGIPLPFPFLFYNFDQSYYAQPAYYGGYYRRPYYAPRYYPRATTTADIIAATIARGTATDGQAITGQAGTVTGLRARSSFRSQDPSSGFSDLNGCRSRTASKVAWASSLYREWLCEIGNDEQVTVKFHFANPSVVKHPQIERNSGLNQGGQYAAGKQAVK